MDTNNYRISYLVRKELENFPIDIQNKIINSLKILLWKRFWLYDFSIQEDNKLKISKSEFLEAISLISESNIWKEKKWAYYTNNDICNYIVRQSIALKYWKDNNFDINYDNKFSLSKLKKIEELLYTSSFFDPTCWSWHFMISVFSIKYLILSQSKKNIKDDEILSITKTIFWNDYDFIASDICKIRFFFFILDKLQNLENITSLAKIINSNCFCIDYISDSIKIKKKFNFLVWNPPYVEYSKYEWNINNNYWNVYADILDNWCKHLEKWGILWFIIPISYIATPRMFKIRDKIENFSEKEYILSFADRPDCLFKWVHQKLNILLAQEWEWKCNIYTSNYNYRYKNERASLFSKITVTENKIGFNWYLAKFWNKLENSILNKIISLNDSNNIYSLQDKNWKDLYLWMRAAFWIKAFSFNPGSNEYKNFKYNKSIYYFILSLLNSSLFRFYWVCVSDCWHITQKELKWIKIPVDIIKDNDIFRKLYINLENQLEKTKEYVWTVQTEYEYKHKKCKEYIDKIDDEIWRIYWLSNEEISYIKTFALDYR